MKERRIVKVLLVVDNRQHTAEYRATSARDYCKSIRRKIGIVQPLKWNQPSMLQNKHRRQFFKILLGRSLKSTSSTSMNIMWSALMVEKINYSRPRNNRVSSKAERIQEIGEIGSQQITSEPPAERSDDYLLVRQMSKERFFQDWKHGICLWYCE